MTSDKEKSWLRLKLREYKVKNSDISELNKRMDIIPVSIALAQAAKESGWGTSRFALEEMQFLANGHGQAKAWAYIKVKTKIIKSLISDFKSS